jgi:hypothetical protein
MWLGPAATIARIRRPELQERGAIGQWRGGHPERPRRIDPGELEAHVGQGDGAFEGEFGEALAPQRSVITATAQEVTAGIEEADRARARFEQPPRLVVGNEHCPAGIRDQQSEGEAVEHRVSPGIGASGWRVGARVGLEGRGHRLGFLPRDVGRRELELER